MSLDYVRRGEDVFERVESRNRDDENVASPDSE
jgi:hypothetical protein